MLLRHNPRLQQLLDNALQILAKRNVQQLDSCNTYCVRAITCDCNKPHDYIVNLAARECSCEKTNCEHFIAAWFAFSQKEFAREEMERAQRNDWNQSLCGEWHGMNEHVCADGYCETATFGYGDEIRCARCDEMYSPARDARL